MRKIRSIVARVVHGIQRGEAKYLANLVVARVTMRGFVINSLPKAGTHLLGKAVSLLGARYAGVQFDHSQLAILLASLPPSPETIPIGIDTPQSVPVNALALGLSRVKRGQFAVWHVPYSDEMAALIAARSMKTVLMLRDPRDVVVSHARYVSTETDHHLYAAYQDLSDDEKIMRSIQGIAPDDDQPGLLDIGARCDSVWRWHDQPANITITFEKIIGSQGGGTEAEQHAELTRLAQHLGLRSAPNVIANVANDLFGGTRTFRKGTIGGWADAFTEAHKDAFKSVAGESLIAMGYESDLDW